MLNAIEEAASGFLADAYGLVSLVIGAMVVRTEAGAAAIGAPPHFSYAQPLTPLLKEIGDA